MSNAMQLWTPDQEDMIRRTYAHGANQDEFAVLLEIAKTHGLNPIKNQIYFVKRYAAGRGEVWSTQVAIDGMRAKAERTARYEGQDEPEYEEREGKLLLCKVRVYRKDWPRPCVGVAYFEEYVQRTKEGRPTKFWAEKPRLMLAKCAEALALRKAFPDELGGLYTSDEIGDEAPQRIEVQQEPSRATIKYDQDGVVRELPAKPVPVPVAPASEPKTTCDLRPIVEAINAATTTAELDAAKKPAVAQRASMSRDDQATVSFAISEAKARIASAETPTQATEAAQ